MLVAVSILYASTCRRMYWETNTDVGKKNHTTSIQYLISKLFNRTLTHSSSRGARQEK